MRRNIVDRESVDMMFAYIIISTRLFRGQNAEVSEFEPYPRRLARPRDKVPKIVSIIQGGWHATVDSVWWHRATHRWLSRTSDLFSATKLEMATVGPKKAALTLSSHVFRDIWPNAHSSPKCTHKSPKWVFRHPKNLAKSEHWVLWTNRDHLSLWCIGASLPSNISLSISYNINLIIFMSNT